MELLACGVAVGRSPCCLACLAANSDETELDAVAGLWGTSFRSFDAPFDESKGTAQGCQAASLILWQENKNYTAAGKERKEINTRYLLAVVS